MENLYKEMGILGIEEMEELEGLGIDTSDSSCIWHSYTDKDYNPTSWMPIFRSPKSEDRLTIEKLAKSFPYTYRKGNLFYCYTLNDLIIKVPHTIIIENCPTYYFKLTQTYAGYVPCLETITDIPLVLFEGKPIESMFQLLKWCKENGHKINQVPSL